MASPGGASEPRPAAPPPGGAGPESRGPRFAGRVGAFAWRKAVGFFERNVESAVLDVERLEPQLRWLSRVGYGAALFFLLFTLGAELFGARLPQAPFITHGNDSTDIAAVVPIPVMAAASLAYILGWALLLTGASDCRRRVFLPILALFLFMLLITTPNESIAQGRGVFLIYCATCLGILGMTGVYLLTYRYTVWRRYPLAEFAGWGAVVAVYIGLLWFFASDATEIARDLDTVMGSLMVLALPFWLWLGVDAADAVLETAEGLVSTLAYALRGWPLPLFVIPIQVSLLVISVLLFSRLAGLVLFFCSSPFLIMASLLLLVARREQGRGTALLILWVTLAAFLFSLFVGLAMQGSDINEAVLGALHLFPPAFLFAFLLLYDVLTFGKRFASVDGAVLPRSGRILMYLGAVLLFLAFTLFKLNIRLVEGGETFEATQQFINSAIFVSMVFLGPLVLLWLVWRRRASFLQRVEAGTA